MQLLGGLTEFYKEEGLGLPHDKAGLWELGWQLSSVLEQYGLDVWKHISPADEQEITYILRNSPDVASIDTAVNLLRWAVLHSQADDLPCDWERHFNVIGRDVVQFLLHRN